MEAGCLREERGGGWPGFPWESTGDHQPVERKIHRKRKLEQAGHVWSERPTLHNTRGRKRRSFWIKARGVHTGQKERNVEANEKETDKRFENAKRGVGRRMGGGPALNLKLGDLGWKKDRGHRKQFLATKWRIL